MSAIGRNPCIVCEKPITENEVLHRFRGRMEDHSFHRICIENVSELDTDCGLCINQIQKNLLNNAYKKSFGVGFAIFTSGACAQRVFTGSFEPERLDYTLALVAIACIGSVDNKIARNRLIGFCLGSVLAIGMSALAKYVEDNVS